MSGSHTTGGRLADNLTRFVRLLRAAGLPLGVHAAAEAAAALEATGLEREEDVYWALHAALVTRHDQSPLFDRAFRLVWLGLPAVGDTGEPPADAPVLEAVAAPASALERLKSLDFERMTEAELAEAERLIPRLALPLRDVPTRRFRPDPHGPRLDPKAIMRRMLRPDRPPALLFRRRRTRPPPLVVLCDVSGSMSRYARVLLRFLHALAQAHGRVHGFVFGTRLTDVTRAIRHPDPDAALARMAASVADWSGGTRIGAALHAFNRDWGRRVLGQGAVALLVTDGLDRDAGAGLAAEADRLHRSCRRLIWLNPLLRWEGFGPVASGARALLPHVDELRPVHNLMSLADLADALARPAPNRLKEAEVA